MPNHRDDDEPSLNPVDGQPIAVNSTFESILGPFYKFKEWEFADAASEDVHPVSADGNSDDEKETNRSRFREAINKVRLHLSNSPSVVEGVDDGSNGSSNKATAASATVKIRNVEMLTLGTNDAGLPVRKYFDWTIGTMQLDNSIIDAEETALMSSVVVMYGDMVNEAESTDR